MEINKRAVAEFLRPNEVKINAFMLLLIVSLPYLTLVNVAGGFIYLITLYLYSCHLSNKFEKGEIRTAWDILKDFFEFLKIILLVGFLFILKSIF